MSNQSKRFEYKDSGEDLRTAIKLFIAALCIEGVLVVLVGGLLVPRPWNFVTVAAILVLDGVAFFCLRLFLKSAHILESGELEMALGPRRLRIPVDSIREVKRHESGVPDGIDVPVFFPTFLEANETVYVLSGQKGRVQIELDEPVTSKLMEPGGVFRKSVSFRRVVANVDEPDDLIAALGGAAPQDEDGEVESRASGLSDLASDGDVSAPPRASRRLEAVESDETSLELVGLARDFGDFCAVDDVSLSIRPGEVLAFLGGNGAGKTTTIRMIVGMLRPSAGKVLVHGQDLWASAPKLRREIGYVPDVPLLYEGLTAREFLWLMGGMYGLERSQSRERCEELLEFVGLSGWADDLIRSFSLGMKRKMAIAAALVHRPSILLLDEVTNGLDPRATREVKDFIAEAARQGTAVLLTTHILDVAQELAHRIALIDQGRVCEVGSLDSLREKSGLPEGSLEDVFLAMTDDGSRRRGA